MWLRTGNVNVTNGSPTVNGGSSAPNFITGGAKPGYIFRGPDGVLNEILSVNSETQITLVSNYGGSTLSNQSYAIIQLSASAYSQVLAQVIALLNSFSTSVSLTTLKIGSPTEAAAVVAALGTLFSYEATASGKFRVSKGATGNDIIIELAVGLSGRARIGMIGNNNLVIDTSPDGSTWTNALTIDLTSPTRATLNVPIIPKIYTIAGLPATPTSGMVAWCSDLGGAPGMVKGDGTGWLRQDPGFATRSTDAAFSLEALTDAEYQEHTGTLTANRAVSLLTTKARPGARFHITRKGSGAFNLQIGTGPLKNLVQNTWCEVIYTGAAWTLMKYGAL